MGGGDGVIRGYSLEGSLRVEQQAHEGAISAISSLGDGGIASASSDRSVSHPPGGKGGRRKEGDVGRREQVGTVGIGFG